MPDINQQKINYMKKTFPALLLTAMIATGASAQDKTDVTQSQTTDLAQSQTDVKQPLTDVTQSQTEMNQKYQTRDSQNQSGKRHSLKVGFDLSMTKSLQTRGMKFQSDALDLTFGMGGRLNLLASVEYIDAHHHHTSFEGIGLGGGLSYRFGNDNLNIGKAVFKVGSTVGNADWKHTYYDVSFRINPLVKKQKSPLFIGLGYRYADSHTAGIGDRSFFYASVGVTF